MKKLVIFDLDGTLADSAQGLMDSMNTALKSINLPPITLEETKKFIGNGSLVFAEKSVKDRVDLKEECYNKFIEDYVPKASSVTTLFKGVDKLLYTLNKMNIKIAVLSNKPQKATEEICNTLLKNYHIDYVWGCNDHAQLKPNPIGVETILSTLKIDRKDAVLVGDGETDVETAENAGIDFIGVLWGNRSKKQLKSKGARTFSHNTKDLLNDILYKYGKNKVVKLFGEFKQFITKGNVLDMAVGVIVGTSFSAIVNSLVKDVITPVISLITGGVNLADLHWTLKEAVLDASGKIITPALTLSYGKFIQAIINFLLIALTVFIFVKTVVTIKKKLDYNQNMKDAVQQKLDTDQPLSKVEERWISRQKKKGNDIPRKVVPPEPEKPLPPPEPSSTDKLLMQILEEIKKDNK